MAVTLSPTLLAAQTAVSRHPLIEVIAGRGAADYPFLGNPIANPTDHHQGISLPIILPSGALAVFYAGQGNNSRRQLRYIVTDAERMSFSDLVVVALDNSRDFRYLDGLVMDTLGKMGIAAQLGADVLVFYTVSAAGVKLSETMITSMGNLSGVSVVETDTGYAALYFREVSGVRTAYLRTSIDFSEWSAPTAVTLPGLDTGRVIRDPRLVRLADDSYFLVFSYVTTDLPSQDYFRPSLIEKATGQLVISVQEENAYLKMDKNTEGWLSSQALSVYSIRVDEAAGKMYATAVKGGSGLKNFRGMIKVDLATWAIERFFDRSTSPAIPQIFHDGDCIEVYQHGGEGELSTIHSSSELVVSLVDYATDTIRSYWFVDRSATYGAEAVQNVTHTLPPADPYPSRDIVASTVVDNKLWLGFTLGYINGTDILIGYFDTDQLSPPYTFTTVIRGLLFIRTRGWPWSPRKARAGWRS